MPTAPPLDRVDVWTTTTDEAEPYFPGYCALLTPDERTRAERFCFHGDRLRFVTARAMVRAMLSRHVDLPPDAWRLRIESYGRPEVANLPPGAPDLRFNISHTEGLVACALTVGRDVGIDIEHVRRQLTHDVAERFFSSQEVADLRLLPKDEQELVFFDYWTLKESYIKARGLGLALPLDQFTFHRHAGRAPHISFAPELHDDPATWQFAQFWPTVEHRMAVAVRRAGEDLPIEVSAIIPLAHTTDSTTTLGDAGAIRRQRPALSDVSDPAESKG
jgi:4'-phosphopantetheinyl transferase